MTRLGALTLASEICDWRRFPRAGRLRALCGLVPGEYSNGGSTRRGHITKTGNAHLRVQLVESAWAYQHGPAVGIALRERQRVQVPSHGTRAELRGSVRGMLREQQLRD